MYNYQNFTPRVDTTPRVKIPMISQGYFAWCTYREKASVGFTHEQGWQEGDICINPSEPATSVQELEEHRASNFEYDYEKRYYDDHYIMLVLKYRKWDEEYTIFLTPEHAHGIIEHGINCDDYGVMIQPEYSWDELNFEVEKKE